MHILVAHVQPLRSKVVYDLADVCQGSAQWRRRAVPARNGAGELFQCAGTTEDDNVGTGPSVLGCGTMAPKQRIPEEGILLQRVFVSLMLQMCSSKYHRANRVNVFCHSRALRFIKQFSKPLFPHLQHYQEFIFKRQCLFPNLFYHACLTVWKTPVLKQTLSIGRNISSKLPFPNFQEMLVRNEHGTATVSGTERPPASVAAAAARQSSVQSFNNFFFFFFAQLPTFLISVFFLIWPE